MMLTEPLPLEVFLLLVALLSSLDHLFVNVAELAIKIFVIVSRQLLDHLFVNVAECLGDVVI